MSERRTQYSDDRSGRLVGECFKEKVEVDSSDFQNMDHIFDKTVRKLRICLSSDDAPDGFPPE